MDDDAAASRQRHPRCHRCPRCGSTSINGAADVRFVDTFLGLVGRRRYICRDCQREFADRPLTPSGPNPIGERRRA